MSTAPSTSRDRPVAPAMTLLAQGVPLSLLMDLVCGPRSAELLAEELIDLSAQRTGGSWAAG